MLITFATLKKIEDAQQELALTKKALSDAYYEQESLEKAYKNAMENADDYQQVKELRAHKARVRKDIETYEAELKDKLKEVKRTLLAEAMDIKKPSDVVIPRQGLKKSVKLKDATPKQLDEAIGLNSEKATSEINADFEKAKNNIEAEIAAEGNFYKNKDTKAKNEQKKFEEQDFYVIAVGEDGFVSAEGDDLVSKIKDAAVWIGKPSAKTVKAMAKEFDNPDTEAQKVSDYGVRATKQVQKENVQNLDGEGFEITNKTASDRKKAEEKNNKELMEKPLFVIMLEDDDTFYSVDGSLTDNLGDAVVYSKEARAKKVANNLEAKYDNVFVHDLTPNQKKKIKLDNIDASDYESIKNAAKDKKNKAEKQKTEKDEFLKGQYWGLEAIDDGESGWLTPEGDLTTKPAEIAWFDTKIDAVNYKDYDLSNRFDSVKVSSIDKEFNEDLDKANHMKTSKRLGTAKRMPTKKDSDFDEWGPSGQGGKLEDDEMITRKSNGNRSKKARFDGDLKDVNNWLNKMLAD